MACTFLRGAILSVPSTLSTEERSLKQKSSTKNMAWGCVECDGLFNQNWHPPRISKSIALDRCSGQENKKGVFHAGDVQLTWTKVLSTQVVFKGVFHTGDVQLTWTKVLSTQVVFKGVFLSGDVQLTWTIRPNEPVSPQWMWQIYIRVTQGATSHTHDTHTHTHTHARTRAHTHTHYTNSLCVPC